MPLFTDQSMLEVYPDAELAQELNPPLQMGDAWNIRLPTSLIMLKADNELPKFPVEGEDVDETENGELTVHGETAPF